ncbi:MAG: hypothetical protein K9N49_04975 [Candidatus Marinimicrobia bacterium]|nr:hypothetical protein [Candidatus Neomarinimicrobiota bacterium]
MHAIYRWVRLVAYACGLAGLVCILLGRGGVGTHSHEAGWVLLGGMFLLFLVSYVFLIAMRLRPKRPPRAGAPDPKP